MSLKKLEASEGDCLFGGWSITVDGGNTTFENLNAAGFDFLGLTTAVGSRKDPTSGSTTSHVNGAGCGGIWCWGVVAGTVLSPSSHGPGRWEIDVVPKNIELHELTRWLLVLSIL